MTHAAVFTAGENDDARHPDSGRQNAPPEPDNSLGETFLDPWRTVRPGPAQRLLEHVQDAIAAHEDTQPRIRARKPQDQLRWEQMVEAVTCALALFVLDPTTSGRLVVPLGARHNLPPRYRRPTQGKPLAGLLRCLGELELAATTLGKHGIGATTLTPLPAFAALVRSCGVTKQDFGFRQDREKLVLRRVVRRGGRREKRLVDYAEDETTAALRAEVGRFNQALSAANIDYVGTQPADTSDRLLRRHFTVLDEQDTRFDQSGRFFGGFWQGLPKVERRYIRIGGEPVVEADYSAAFTHIAFAQLGLAPPPVDDLYRIPGLERLGRKQIKSALNAFYFDQGEGRTRWPDTFDAYAWSDPDTGEVFEGFPAEFTPARVRRAIAAHYPALANQFGRGVGYGLMFTESRIMARALSKANAHGITALPLHDALIAPQSAGPRVASLMEKASKEVIGLEVPVKLT